MTPTDLRAWRRARELTQDQFGALLGLQGRRARRITVSQWERGREPIPQYVRIIIGLIDEKA